MGKPLTSVDAETFSALTDGLSRRKGTERERGVFHEAAMAIRNGEVTLENAPIDTIPITDEERHSLSKPDPKWTDGATVSAMLLARHGARRYIRCMTTHRPDRITILRLAAAAGVDPRSAARALRGEPVRGIPGDRIRRALGGLPVEEPMALDDKRSDGGT